MPHLQNKVQQCITTKTTLWALSAQSDWLWALITRAITRSTVDRTPVFDRRTDPVLRSACSRRVTTMWVNRSLQVSQLGQLSLSSFRGR